MSPWSLHWPPRRQACLSGIDLGSGEASLLACSRGLRSWRVEQCAVAPIPAEALQGARILQFDLMANLLRDLVASADSGRSIALALPSAGWRQVLELPAGLRPWAWRPWLCEQAEHLARVPASQLAWGIEVLQGRPLRTLLSVHPLELVQDWQGLAEAAGLSLALLDDRPRVMQLALHALGLAAADGKPLALAEVRGERCVIHHWRVGQPPEQLDGDALDEVTAPPGQGGWVCGPPAACLRWAERFASRWGGPWSALDPLASLDWRSGLERPSETGSLLAALGLALRPWRS